MYHGARPDLAVIQRNGSSFLAIDPLFGTITGAHPQLSVIARNDEFPFAHEAGAVDPYTGTVYFTSNQYYEETGGGARTKKVTISKLYKTRGCYRWEVVTPSPDIIAANGGTFWTHGGHRGILFCQQGSTRLAAPSGLVFMRIGRDTAEDAQKREGGDSQTNEADMGHMRDQDHHADYGMYASFLVLNSFYGRPFNSPNDVAVLHRDGTVWFTDPHYGYIQELKSASPKLPNMVYCYNPETKSLRAVADEFNMPNGITFSPNGYTCYITDTQAYVGHDGKVDDQAKSSIYAYDVLGISGRFYLSNKRLFAFSDCAAPDGIKCDEYGNVFAACLDGIHVWDKGGNLLGKILIPEGVSNFCFLDSHCLILFSEHVIYEVKFG